ncbi:MAG: hypothetical protein Q4D82_01415 [Neisseria sp.]|nr:hypothetical protein [Neisseria sp.]
MMLQFGAGELFAQGISDAFGNLMTMPTPIRIAGLQEFSVDVQTELKSFHGQGRFALATAQGKSKVTGKAKGALLNGTALNTLVFGQEIATGKMKAIHAEAVGLKIPSSGAYTLTPAAPQRGKFTDDLGVMAEDGSAMVKVAANPQAGQYSVSAAGVYTFNEADKGKTVYPSFTYFFDYQAAKRIDLNNLPMGNNASFKLFYVGTFQGKKAYIELYSVTSGKLGLFRSKNDDFSVPEIDFEASTDATGLKVGFICLME